MNYNENSLMDKEKLLFDQVQIIFQDDDILVVNKPAGLLTISDGYDPTQPYLKNFLESGFGRIWVVHRLDRLTAGLLVFARNPEAHRNLSNQFEKRKVEKKYYCYVIGRPDWQNQTYDCALRVNADKKHRTLADLEKGKPSKTSFTVLQKHVHVSFVEAIPFTGYTHQIRSHLYSLGFPIYGDYLYGFKEKRFQELLPENMCEGYYGFLMLCAKQITITLPMTHQTMVFSIPLPKHFLDFETTSNK